ncbi:MvdC/MvdD family ATP grasp protein [Sphingomonas sp.]|jgi:glutathione synthase/RimK-type ligase-like ATP-grasp enzyme|uniref:MvdC/MvdD family ATP grasp protein n=1 Tax=Sphingomonas sp. TaxID=28214 RepID=UPI002DE80E5A|nr:ATP-dependent carboxylate-amine ligase [Sphingomonas sp.]
MILLVTNKRDITSDFVVLELKRRGADFVRLNTEDLPSASVTFTPDQGWTFHLSDGVALPLNSVPAAYYRRPGAPLPSEDADEATTEYVSAEWSAVLRSLWNALEGRWLSSPFAILRAEDKPRQLSAASELGFRVPSTLISNVVDEVIPFSERRACIGKPLRTNLIGSDEAGKVIFTSRLRELRGEDPKAIQLAPIIIQEEVLKRRDLRVTVVGSQVFAAAIESQEQLETSVDWRKGSRTDLAHHAVELPEHEANLCVELTRHLGLRFGAIDLIEDVHGQLWFLEINPNGQWAWIERRTGLPISSAIVDLLLERQ